MCIVQVNVMIFVRLIQSQNTKHSPNSLFLDREPVRMVQIKEIDALSGLAACIVGIGRLHWVPLFLYSVEGDY